MVDSKQKRPLDEIQARIDKVETHLSGSRKVYERVMDTIVCPECDGTGHHLNKPDIECEWCEGTKVRGRYEAKKEKLVPRSEEKRKDGNRKR